jgi:hypothetical protein
VYHWLVDWLNTREAAVFDLAFVPNGSPFVIGETESYSRHRRIWESSDQLVSKSVSQPAS